MGKTKKNDYLLQLREKQPGKVFIAKMKENFILRKKKFNKAENKEHDNIRLEIVSTDKHETLRKHQMLQQINVFSIKYYSILLTKI